MSCLKKYIILIKKKSFSAAFCIECLHSDQSEAVFSINVNLLPTLIYISLKVQFIIAKLPEIKKTG